MNKKEKYTFHYSYYKYNISNIKSNKWLTRDPDHDEDEEYIGIKELLLVLGSMI